MTAFFCGHVSPTTLCNKVIVKLLFHNPLKNDFQNTSVRSPAFTRKWWQCTNTSEVFRIKWTTLHRWWRARFLHHLASQSCNHKIMCSSDPNLRLLCQKRCTPTHIHIYTDIQTQVHTGKSYTHSPLPQAPSFLNYSLDVQTKGDKIKNIYYFTINLQAIKNSEAAEKRMQVEFAWEVLEVSKFREWFSYVLFEPVARWVECYDLLFPFPIRLQIKRT